MRNAIKQQSSIHDHTNSGLKATELQINFQINFNEIGSKKTNARDGLTFLIPLLKMINLPNIPTFLTFVTK